MTGFLSAMIFLVVQIGIVSYLIYNLYSQKEENYKDIGENDIKAAFNLRKMVVLENSASLILYGVLISNREILHFGRGEILTVSLLISIGLMMAYLYMFDNFMEKLKKFQEHNHNKENVTV